MKKFYKILIVCFLSILFINVNSQELNGLSEIKLFMTLPSFKEKLGIENTITLVEKKTKKQKNTMESDELTQKYKNDIFLDNTSKTLIKLDSNLNSFDIPTRISYNNLSSFLKMPSTEIYYLSRYQIASLTVRNIALIFKSDTLVYIQVSSPLKELITALKEKYTPTSDLNKIDTLKCRYTYTGAVNDKYAFHYKTSWIYKDISANYTYELDYNDECKIKRFVDYFLLASHAFTIEQGNFLKSQYDPLQNQKKYPPLIDKL